MGDFNNINKIKDLKTLNTLKENFDRAIDAQREVIRINEEADKLAKQSFNTIKENFENISNLLFKTKGGRNIISKYVNCIKESKDLGKLHILSECIRKADKELDTVAYVNEALSMIGCVNKTSYNESVKKLGAILSEAYRYLKGNCELKESNNKLDEAIDYLATHKKTPSTLSKYMGSLKTIKEHVEGNCVNQTNFENAIDEFNEKYGESLDENTKAIVKELAESSDKEQVFNKYKESCLNKIEDKKKQCAEASIHERLNMIRERVENKAFNESTVNRDVYNLNEIMTSLE